VKNLTRSELTILIYLIIKGITKPKLLSSQLEIDLSYTYKILKKLEEKQYINKIENDHEIEYMAKEHIIL
jgi:DNA-binding MarR family transcriptional regulator